VVGGWVAWQWLPGAPADLSGASTYWGPLVSVSRAFHAALADVPAPRWLGRDGSPWTVSDQVAWGERDPAGIVGAAGGPLRGQLESLLAALRPVDLPAQLVHGNFGGSVLFADGEPPAVTDFSPMRRPADLAVAVAAVDALLWSGAGPEILDELASQPQAGQLLARALVYRLASEVILRSGRTGLDGVSRAGQPVTDLVLARLAGRPRPARYLDDARLSELAGQAAGTAVTGMAVAGTRGQGPAVGHTRALRRLARLADGRTVFLKAAGPGADLTAEIAAYESIGQAPFMPRLIAASRDPVPLIILEALPADGWVTRWTPLAIADTEELIAQVHAASAPAGLPRWTDPGSDGPAAWRAIAREPDRLLRMGVCGEQWLSAHLEALGGAAGRARVSGDHLVHGDVHPANLCYRAGRLVLVDWATAAAGDPWFDTHNWLVTMAAEGGPTPDERQGPGAAGHAALIAGDQVLLAPSRGSDPVLFNLRRQRLATALTWAARLLQLPRPESP
jgi:phosphotransferase family enzyme